MNEDQIHKLRSGLEVKVSELMAEWQLDNSMFWAVHPDISIQASPFMLAGVVSQPIAIFSEHERALRSIATHVMDGQGFIWDVCMTMHGTGYFVIMGYEGQ